MNIKLTGDNGLKTGWLENTEHGGDSRLKTAGRTLNTAVTTDDVICTSITAPAL